MHRSLSVFGDNIVTNPEWFPHQDQYSAGKVRQASLDSKAYGDTGRSQQSHNRSRIHTDLPGNDEAQQAVHGRIQHGQQEFP